MNTNKKIIIFGVVGLLGLLIGIIAGFKSNSTPTQNLAGTGIEETPVEQVTVNIPATTATLSTGEKVTIPKIDGVKDIEVVPVAVTTTVVNTSTTTTTVSRLNTQIEAMAKQIVSMQDKYNKLITQRDEIKSKLEK